MGVSQKAIALDRVLAELDREEGAVFSELELRLKQLGEAAWHELLDADGDASKLDEQQVEAVVQSAQDMFANARSSGNELYSMNKGLCALLQQMTAHMDCVPVPRRRRQQLRCTTW